MPVSIVPDSFQTLSVLTMAAPDSFPRDNKGRTDTGTGPVSAKDSKLLSVDTVNISYRSPRTAAEVNKEEVKTEDTSTANSSANTDRSIAKVQFVYNPKGNLSIRYMDTSSRLIYQTPSELMLQMQETAPKSDAAVDTRA